MKDNELFDSLINQKLTEASTTTPPGVWDKFLHSDAMQSHGQNQNFDEAVRNSMTQMTVPSVGNEWGAFKKHWNAATVHSEKAFDHAVRTKVKQSNPHSGPEANTILQSAIQQSIIYRRQLWLGKVAEVALLIVVLASIFHFLPDLGTLKMHLKKHAPTEATPPTIPSSNIYDHAYATPLAPDDIDGLTTTTVTGRKNNMSNEPKGTTHPIETSHASVNQSIENTLNPQNMTYPINHGRDQQIFEFDRTTNNILFEPVNTPFNDDALNTTNLVMASAYMRPGMTTFADSSQVVRYGLPFDLRTPYSEPATIATLQSTAQSMYATAHHHGIQPVRFNVGNGRKIISEMWIGAKIGQAYNLIRTPVSNIQTRSYQYQNINSSIAGFNLELKSDFVNIETGLYYSFKLFGQGNYDKDRGHFVNIPLSLKKDFFTKKKFSPYLKAGPDFTVLVKAAYDSNLDNPSYQNLPAALAPSKDFANATVEDGIIHSGNLNRNSYFGIHGGIGVEYKFSNSNKLALELVHQLNPFDKGLGINNHKFTETSINLGYKHILYYN